MPDFKIRAALQPLIMFSVAFLPHCPCFPSSACLSPGVHTDLPFSPGDAHGILTFSTHTTIHIFLFLIMQTGGNFPRQKVTLNITIREPFLLYHYGWCQYFSFQVSKLSSPDVRLSLLSEILGTGESFAHL